ncbi:glucose-6-phosphate isomerase [Methanococcus voltae]|uniref:glucose-6-phosphate isomerase n=1 Tax=Methanococcus voltae TaxID=2188 RepID=UPI001AE12455|nr:glucose-6-phosphate isomerase [Methanococcus voltae]MBP2143600.1 glucose-6-phosphate isomerase [Methanococcus voltae]
MKGIYKFNFDNVLKDKIGETGISIDEIDELRDFTNLAKANVTKKYEKGELGFIEVLNEDLEIYEEVKELSKEFDYIIIIGIGGSILGSKAIHQGIYGSSNTYHPKVFYLDNSDPEKIYETLKAVKLEKTLIFVISKSGNTVETLANYFVIKKHMDKNNITPAKPNFVAITGGGLLQKIADKEGYMCYKVPENVGGRFSVLSAVGLAPLACLNVDIHNLVKGAKKMNDICQTDNIFRNPALLNSLIHYKMDNTGKKISLMMPYIGRLHQFGMWYRQLWAESLGKDGNGQTPVIALGATDQHSQLQLYMDGPEDKIMTFLKVNSFKQDYSIETDYDSDLKGHKLSELINSEQLGTEKSITEKGIPNVKITLSELNEYTLGMLTYSYELQTAYSGELFCINAFNQPAVEHAKKLSHAVLKGSIVEKSYNEIKIE